MQQTLLPEPAPAALATRVAAATATLRAVRWPAPLPEPFIAAVAGHLAGSGSLAAVQATWPPKAPFQTARLPLPLSPAAEDALDAADIRALDLARLAGTVPAYLAAIADRPQGLVQALAHLEAAGLALPDRLALLLRAPIAAWFTRTGGPVAGQSWSLATRAGGWVPGTALRPLGRVILSYLPAHFETMRRALPGVAPAHLGLARLLLLCNPPALDAAWTLAQDYPKQAGSLAAILLPADPARFTAWARSAAGPGTTLEPYERLLALDSLLTVDPAHHRDLALAAAQEPPPVRRWEGTALQETGMKALFRLDPTAAWPLVEQAALGDSASLATAAIILLDGADFGRGRPALERVVARAPIEAGLQALRALLTHDWPERPTYVAGLLAHRSKQIRTAAATWLIAHDPAVVDHVAPLLENRAAGARLAAVEVLAQGGGARGRALLAAHREAEKAGSVRAAIADVLGTAPAGAGAAGGGRADADSAQAQFARDAEVALRGVRVPALRWWPAAQRPPLAWAGGAPVPAHIVDYLLFRQARCRDGQPDAGALALRPLLDRAAAAAWARALWDAWLGAGAPARDAWALQLAGALGDDSLVPELRKQIAACAKGNRGALAARLVAVLATLGTDLALSEVEALTHVAKPAPVAVAAKAALAATAERAGCSLAALSDRIVPRLGLGPTGARVFSFGPRTFTARLRPDGTLRLTDGAGKTLPGLPRPLASDDAAEAALAAAAFKTFKAALKPAWQHQVARLETALIDGRNWPLAQWHALFLEHPLLRPAATTLVWGLVAPDGAGCTQLFRPLEDGTLTDADDEPVALPADGTVRLVYPLDLDAATLDAWRTHLADYAVTPVVPQLARPVVTVPGDQQAARWWTAHEGVVLNGLMLKGRYLKAGWQHGAVQDGGQYYIVRRRFEGAAIDAVLETTGLSIASEQLTPAALVRLGFVPAAAMPTGSGAYDVFRDEDKRLLPLGTVPPRVFAEAAADVAGFAAAGRFDPEWRRKLG